MALIDDLKTACSYTTIGTVSPLRTSQFALFTKAGGLVEKQYLYGQSVTNIAFKFAQYVSVLSSYPADMAALRTWADGYNALGDIRMSELFRIDTECNSDAIAVDFVNIGLDVYVIYTTQDIDIPTYYIILNFSGSTLSGVSVNQSTAYNEPLPPGYASPYAGYNVLALEDYETWQFVVTEDTGGELADTTQNINCACNERIAEYLIDCISGINFGDSSFTFDLWQLREYLDRNAVPNCQSPTFAESCLLENILCGWTGSVTYTAEIGSDVLMIEIYCRQSRRVFFAYKTNLMTSAQIYCSQLQLQSTPTSVSEVRFDPLLAFPNSLYMTRTGYPNVRFVGYTAVQQSQDCAQDAGNGITPVYDFIDCAELETYGCGDTYGSRCTRPVYITDTYVFYATFDPDYYTPVAGDPVLVSGEVIVPRFGCGEVLWVDPINGILAAQITDLSVLTDLELGCGRSLKFTISNEGNNCITTQLCTCRVCDPCIGMLVEFTNSGSYGGFPYGAYPMTQRLRLLIELIDPFYDTSDIQSRTSGGFQRKIHSVMRKGYTLRTDWLPERECDLIAKILQHDSVVIYKDGTPLNIVCEGGITLDYAEKFNKYMVKAKVYIADSGIYNDYC